MYAHTAYRQAPTLKPRFRGPTPEKLVDQYMQQQQSPRYHGGRVPSHRPAPSAPANAEEWWKLYVLSTQMRGAATLQQSFRKQAWADSLRSSSPRNSSAASPRSVNGLSPRSRAARPAPQRPVQRGAAREAFQKASAYPPYRQFDPASMPAEMKSVGVQAEFAGEGGFESRPHRAPPPPPPSRPVSPDELRHAQKLINDKLTTRFSTLQRAFKTMDADRSGSISRAELEFTLEVFNLQDIRKATVDRLFSLIDYDGNGEFDFQEFCRVLTAPDVMNMSGPKKRVDTRAEMARRAIEAKKEAQERVAANVGLTVEEYCDYYGLKEIVV